MIYNMLFYLKNCGSNQRKTKTALIDYCLSILKFFFSFACRVLRIDNTGAGVVLVKSPQFSNHGGVD